MANKASELSDKGKVYVKRAAVFVIFFLDNKWFKSLVIVFFVVLAGWMLYGKVWSELTRSVRLPETIADTSTELNIETLRAINTSRSERVKKSRKDFSSYAKYFGPAPSQ